MAESGSSKQVDFRLSNSLFPRGYRYKNQTFQEVFLRGKDEFDVVEWTRVPTVCMTEEPKVGCRSIARLIASLVWSRQRLLHDALKDLEDCALQSSHNHRITPNAAA